MLAQELARKNRGYPCFLDESPDSTLLQYFLMAKTEDIVRYDWPPPWANHKEKNMLEIIVFLKKEEKIMFSVSIKEKNGTIQCFDASEIFE